MKAFDTINHNFLLRKFEGYGARGVLRDWFKLYFSESKRDVQLVRTILSFQSVNCGVPPDSILGPLLIIIYKRFTKFCGKLIPYLFADDTKVCIGRKKKASKLLTQKLEIYYTG